MTIILLSVFISLIVLVIFLEYHNEKKYQEERRNKNLKGRQKRPPLEKKEPKKQIPETRPVKTETSTPLPEASHPKFNHSRLVDMGLSNEEAKEFVTELIPQIEEQIPLIKEAMALPDFHQMERLTHNIKGSATNLGTGGVSDLLVDYNTYLKSGSDIAIAEAYFKHLLHYTNELKEQYT